MGTAKAGVVSLDFWRDGKKVTQQARLNGGEQAQAVAARLQKAFGDVVKVRAEASRLRMTIKEAQPKDAIKIRASSSVAASIGLGDVVGRWQRQKRPALTALFVFAVLWTIYHVLMQKMGILRVYSRRGQVGSPGLDRAMVFLWFVTLLTWLGADGEVRAQVMKRSKVARVLVPWTHALEPYLPWVAGAFLLAALVVTAIYLRGEIAAPGGFSWPRNLFLLSILMLYATFLYDVVVGYAVMSFSHSIEYLAFVYLFARRRYQGVPPQSSAMARWAANGARSMVVFCGVLLVVFAVARYGSRTQLKWYIAGSGFLHFIYDGWIWKVRKPQVASALGLQNDASGRPAVAA